MRRLFAGLLCLSFLALPARADGGPKYVALTFDDGPSGRYTRQLLDGLQERGVTATFLLCGYRMEQYPDLTQRMVDEGHEIGYHGYSHKPMDTMSRRDIAKELSDSQALLPAGYGPVFFRPPGGCCSDGVRQVAEVRGLAILHWSVDPRDWASHDTAAIEKAVLQTIRDGDIVLLHDMTASSVQASLDIVDALLEQGYEPVTVRELARLRGTAIRGGQTYSKFPPDEKTGAA